MLTLRTPSGWWCRVPILPPHCLPQAWLSVGSQCGFRDIYIYFPAIPLTMASKDTALYTCESQLSSPEEESPGGQWSLCSCLGAFGPCAASPSPLHLTMPLHPQLGKQDAPVHELPWASLAIFILSGCLPRVFIYSLRGGNPPFSSYSFQRILRHSCLRLQLWECSSQRR